MGIRSAAVLLLLLTAAVFAGCATNTSPPSISGTPVDGNTLTANPGTWKYKGSISFSYAWQRCDSGGASCQTVQSGPGSTYALGPPDVGSTFRVAVTGTDADGAQGASTATSPATTVVQALPPRNGSLPQISGTTTAGQTLTATQGTWTGTPPITYGYQWRRCAQGGGCTDISLATGTSYVLGTADVGSTIAVVVTASNQAASVKATSNPTAVIAAAGHDPVVVAVGDIACAPGDTSNDCQQGLTANVAAAQNPDAVITLGDNQYQSGLLSEFNGTGAYGATWGTFNSIVYPSPGNHEYVASSSASGYFSYFGSRAGPSTGDYSYNLGAWHLIALDSSCSDSGCSDVVQGETTSAQVTWLQNDLAAHPAACTLAYWHHPRFSSSWTSDSPGTGSLFSALYNAHADLVLNGHDHVYQRYAQQSPTAAADSAGVREIVAGTGGENLFSIISPEANLQSSDQNDFGVLVLTLHGSSYSWAFKRLDGTVVDSGTTSCHGSGTSSASVRAARDARRWPQGPIGRPLRFDARSVPVGLRAARRFGLPVDVHLTRAADVTIDVALRAGSRSRLLARFRETETELSRPFTRLRLRLPRALSSLRAPAALTLRLRAVSGARTRSIVLHLTLLRP